MNFSKKKNTIDVVGRFCKGFKMKSNIQVIFSSSLKAYEFIALFVYLDILETIPFSSLASQSQGDHKRWVF